MVRWFFIATLLLGAPAFGQPDPIAEAARIEQEVLPALSARREAAAARGAAWEAVFAGEAPLASAWPRPLDTGSPAALRALLAELDAQAIARRRERHVSGDVPPEIAARVREATAAALDAEEAADGLTRRALLGLKGALTDYPYLTDSAVEAARAPLHRARERVEASLPEDDVSPDVAVTLTRLVEADARWAEVASGLRLHAAGLSPVPPDLEPEYAALGRGVDDPIARDAAARLGLAIDLVPAAREPLRTWLVEVAIPARLAATAAPPASEDGAEGLQAAVREAEEALGRAPTGDDPLDVALREAAGAHLAEAKARQELHGREAERVRTASAAAQDARREADRVSHDPSTSHPASAMRTASRQWTAGAWEAVEAFEVGLGERARARQERLEPLLDDIEQVLARPEEAAADKVYRRLRAEIDLVRAAVREGRPDPTAALAAAGPPPGGDAREAQLHRWTQEATGLVDPAAREVTLALLIDTREAIAAEQAPVARSRELARDAFGEVLLDLRRAKAIKHRLAKEISWSERRVERGALISDAAAEVALLQTQLVALLRERLQWLLGLPPLLLDFNRLTGALWGLSRLIFLLVLAWFALRRVQTLARVAIRGVERITGEFTRAVRAAIEPPLEAALRPVVVLITAWILQAAATQLAPELGVLVAAFAVAAVVRIFETGMELIVTTPDEPRPSLWEVERPVLDLLRRTLRLIAFWYVISWTLHALLSRVFFADTLATALNMPVRLVGLGILVYLLMEWEPLVVARMAQFPKLPARLGRWMSRPRSPWTAAPRALVAMTWLTLAWLYDLAQGRLAERSGYGALVSAMDRARWTAGEIADDDGRRVDEATRARIVDAEAAIDRPEASEALRTEVAAWREERRRGTLVLTGDRGAGATTFLSQNAAVLEQEGRPPRRTQLDQPMRTREDALRMFQRHFALTELPETLDALVETLLALPSEVHVIDHAHRSFLRVVGGFDALRTLLYVCNATSERHLWLLVVHRPAWGFLKRLGSLVNLGTVREVIDLAPLTGPQLRALALGRTQAAGFTVDFRRLVRPGPFGSSPEVEEDRTIRAFFRLLAEESGGCPRTALAMWVDGLRPVSGDRFEVKLPPDPGADIGDDLQRHELFVLAALRTLDRLSLVDLADVVDLSLEATRAVVRGLEQRRLVHVTEHGAALDMRRTRPIIRTLRRRHVLQWGV